MGKIRKPLWDRFWDKVVVTDTCWLWVGAKTRRKFGYGAIRGCGDVKLLAHRLSFEKYKGQIPNGMLVLHTCDNPLCVNPEHLFIGTQKDNMRDMRDKKRGPSIWYEEKPDPPGKAFGECGGTAKLKERDVINIFYDTRLQQEIADSYGISNQQVSNIKNGISWKHLNLCVDCHDAEHAKEDAA
jgi:hypothetical protein